MYLGDSIAARHKHVATDTVVSRRRLWRYDVGGSGCEHPRRRGQRGAQQGVLIVI